MRPLDGAFGTLDQKSFEKSIVLGQRSDLLRILTRRGDKKKKKSSLAAYGSILLIITNGIEKKRIPCETFIVSICIRLCVLLAVASVLCDY